MNLIALKKFLILHQNLFVTAQNSSHHC